MTTWPPRDLDGARTGKHVRMESSLLEKEEPKKNEQEICLERENEAIRKKLEANRLLGKTAFSFSLISGA